MAQRITPRATKTTSSSHRLPQKSPDSSRYGGGIIYSEHARAFGRESTDFTELVLPALTLSLLAVAPLARASRAAMLDVLSSDFVRTARAIPLSRAKVLFVYAFGKALPPVLTTIGMVFSLMQLARSVPNAAACRRRIAPPHRRAGARRGGSALDCTV
jgi:hypothetical protein